MSNEIPRDIDRLERVRRIYDLKGRELAGEVSSLDKKIAQKSQEVLVKSNRLEGELKNISDSKPQVRGVLYRTIASALTDVRKQQKLKTLLAAEKKTLIQRVKVHSQRIDNLQMKIQSKKEIHNSLQEGLQLEEVAEMKSFRKPILNTNEEKFEIQIENQCEDPVKIDEVVFSDDGGLFKLVQLSEQNPASLNVITPLVENPNHSQSQNFNQKKTDSDAFQNHSSKTSDDADSKEVDPKQISIDFAGKRGEQGKVVVSAEPMTSNGVNLSVQGLNYVDPVELKNIFSQILNSESIELNEFKLQVERK